MPKPTKTSQGGVWNLPTRKGRPKPYGLQWREDSFGPGGSIKQIRRTEFLPTREKRDARAVEVRRLLKARQPASLSPGEVAEYRAFKEAIGDTDWKVVVEGYRMYLRQLEQENCQVTVEQACNQHLEKAQELVTKGSLSPDTLRQKRHKLGLFSEQFGDLALNAVDPTDVEEWIMDFAEVRTDATFNNYRKHLKAVFTPFVLAGAISRNPLASIRRRDDTNEKVEILQVDEARRLFAYALTTPRYTVALGRLALEAFIGLRFMSSCRLEKSDINFEDRGILLPKRKLKTKKRHYIDGVIPAHLWDWLAVTPEACWALTPRQYMRLKSDLFLAADVPHPRNCLRHSFATYDVAAHKSSTRTAYLLCHQNPVQLYAHYNGIAKMADGLRYQAILPTNVSDPHSPVT